MKNKKYYTNVTYTGRESKASYIYNKYEPILKGSILDVGADEMYLKTYLPSDTNYVGVGFGKKIDINLNLENAILPFEKNSFDTVLCLDLLEHLETAHSLIHELFRVSKKYIIISLPNPWGLFFQMLMDEKTFPTPMIKWWGLPVEAPEDRHRWFYSEAEAKHFLEFNAKSAGFEISQLDSEVINPKLGGVGIKGVLRRFMIKQLLRKDLGTFGLDNGTIWCVLKKVN